MGFRDRIRGITRPDPDVVAVDPEELRLRLMALNHPTSPWHVRDGAPEKVDLVVEWKTTDPYWKDIFTEVGVNDTFATHLRFHPDANEVRSRDRCFGWYTTTDSDGFSSSRQTWKEGQLHENAEGKVNGQLFRFDTADFKKTLKETIIGAGWIYRAIVLRRL
ncbi:hypothetical protein A5707_12140 [Mycobacterium kyorinense]|uniref:Uncharacterized protein n=1 Tax=Mycobacterium kyorinense TaxID=487514 RepID=A0A1A2ZQT4_9MYCO|nr:hypothetical protein [Mycobacterium kyorinense]OBI52680.1 hypothetical protein A5707_12140 [Mycobacterium kyorinense]